MTHSVHQQLMCDFHISQRLWLSASVPSVAQARSYSIPSNRKVQLKIFEVTNPSSLAPIR